MEGFRRREKRETDRTIALAWMVENFSREGNKLKGLDHYLRQDDNKTKAQAMLAALRTFQAGGANMTITMIARD